MKIITKLQEKLSSNYINNKISESEFAAELKYLKDIQNDMIRLKQSMIDTSSVSMDELLDNREEPTIDNMARIYEELLSKYTLLKFLLLVPIKAWSVPDSEDEDEDEHIKRVYTIMGYHAQVMDSYIGKDISSEVFIEKMSNACDLNMSVYEEIVDKVTVLLEDLTPCPVTNADTGKGMGIIDVSSILMGELYTHEYGKYKDEELQELYATYVTKLKETVEVAINRIGS